MMQHATVSIPLFAVLAVGGLSDATGSDFSYAEVSPGLYDLCEASESGSLTALWLTPSELTKDQQQAEEEEEVSIGYEAFVQLAARRTRYEFIGGFPKDWSESRPRIDSTYLDSSIEDDNG